VSNGGTLNLTNDTFYQNSAGAGNGGAVFVTLGSTVFITNSTFDGNSANGSPTSSGGAIYSDGAHVTIANTIFAADTALVPGTNEIDSTTTNTNFPPVISVTASDIFEPGGTNPFGAGNFDPKLGVFGNWGGLVPTLPLLIGSPCYGAGSPSFAPATDARGYTRPNPPSIGAFDLPFAVAPPPTISPKGGTFIVPPIITITNLPGTPPGSTIYVTTDGSPPSTSSPTYTGPFHTIISGTETISAILNIPGYTQSPPASDEFAITLTAPSYPAGLQLFSSPFSYPGIPLDTLFGYTGVKLAVWNPSLSEYDITPNGEAGSIQAGVGYWGRFPHPVTFTSVGTPAPTNVPFTINLKPGWNEIGDPFPITIPLTSLTFGSNNVPFAQASSGSNPLVSPSWFLYDPTANNGSGGYDTTTEFDPGVGNWCLAFTNTTINVTYK
jgi:predicted outer membrane repeat protein